MLTDTTALRAEFETFWEAERQRTWDAADMPSHRGTTPSEAWASGYKESTWIGFQAGHASATQQHEGLRKDAERLDWMDANPYIVSPDSYGYLASNAHRRWLANVPAGDLYKFPTLREAIDAGVEHHGDAITGAASSPISTDSTPTVDAALSASARTTGGEG